MIAAPKNKVMLCYREHLHIHRKIMPTHRRPQAFTECGETKNNNVRHPACLTAPLGCRLNSAGAIPVVLTNNLLK